MCFGGGEGGKGRGLQVSEAQVRGSQAEGAWRTRKAVLADGLVDPGCGAAEKH
jgi:hypothetical protein